MKGLGLINNCAKRFQIVIKCKVLVANVRTILVFEVSSCYIVIRWIRMGMQCRPHYLIFDIGIASTVRPITSSLPTAFQIFSRGIG